MPTVMRSRVDHCYAEILRNQTFELSTLIPAKLFDTVYITNNNEKRVILDDFLKKLESVGESKLNYTASQASSLIKVLHDCLEEANILIVTTAIQVILRLLELIPAAFSETITKHILVRALGKFQSTSSKSSLNDMILNLLSVSVKSGSMTRSGLVDLLCDTIQSSKKTNSRECGLMWLTYRLSDFDTNDPGRMSLRDSIEWSYEAGSNKDLKVAVDSIHARLTDILNKETNSKIKGIIKTHLKKFEEVNLRKNKADKQALEPEVNLASKRNQTKKPTEEKSSPKFGEDSNQATDTDVSKPAMKPEPSSRLQREQFDLDKKSLLNYSTVGSASLGFAGKLARRWYPPFTRHHRRRLLQP